MGTKPHRRTATRQLTLLAFAATLAAAGCEALAPFGAAEASTVQDGSVDRDTTVADATVDLRQLADLPAPDKLADLPAGDAVDGASSPPCASAPNTLTVAQSYSAKMVVCADSAPAGKLGVNQCKAAAICNLAGGWRLCTATDFLDLGGASKGVLIDAWIAACVRDGGDPVDPIDSTCGACTVSAALFKVVEYGCGGGNPVATSGERVGVTTHAGCARVGLNKAANSAFWSATDANTKLSAAVCCR